jgi:tetratricopeptide (TPR) repeat protein
MGRGSDTVDLLASLAETHMAAGRVVEAAAAFERAIAAAGARAPAARAALHARHGWALHGTGRIAEAEAAFARAVELDPEDLGALIALSSLAFRARRFEDVERLAARALTLRPGEPYSLFYLGRARMERGDWPGACAAFEGALAAMPAHRNARAHLAIALQHAGRIEEARRILDYARLVTVEDVRAVPGFGSVATFHAALAARIRTFPTLMRDRPNRAGPPSPRSSSR